MNHPIVVVIVDDKASITDLFESYIGILDIPCQLVPFNDSRLALEFVKSHSIDILITDYGMPYVNGLEIIEAAPDGASKIMISGYVPEITAGQLDRLNAKFYEKPVPMKEIGRIILERAARL